MDMASCLYGYIVDGGVSLSRLTFMTLQYDLWNIHCVLAVVAPSSMS